MVKSTPLYLFFEDMLCQSKDDGYYRNMKTDITKMVYKSAILLFDVLMYSTEIAIYLSVKHYA